MGLIKNAINFGNGFNIGAVAPIDSRMRVKSVEDLTSVWTAEIPAYKGMIVSVMDTSEVYVLKDADNYTSIDSWVKLGSASGTADALKDAKAYTDQEVKKLTDGAVKTNTTAIAKLNGDVNTVGSVAKAVADAVAAEKSRAEGKEGELKTAIDNEKTARENAINNLDATVGETTIAEGKHVAVQVVEENGKLKSLTVTENDIASATGLTAETKAREDADKDINAKIGQVGTGTNLVAMIDAEADRATKAESELATRVTANETAIAKLNGDANTEGSVAKAVAAEKTRAEGVESGLDSRLVTVEGDYLKSADKTELSSAISTEQNRAEGAESALDTRLDVIEGEGAGSIKKALADAKDYTKTQIDSLNSTNTGDGIHVDVTVAQKNGVITAVTVSESDIASAAVLEKVKGDVDKFFKDADFTSNAKDTLKELQAYINSDAEGASAMQTAIANNTAAIANNKAAIEAEVTRATDAERANANAIDAEVTARTNAIAELGTRVTNNETAITTLNGNAATEGSVAYAVAAETQNRTNAINALNANVNSKGGSHVTVNVTEAKGVITAVTVSESDIASADELKALKDAVGNGFSADNTVAAAIDTNKQAIADEKKSREDADKAINAKIGTVETDKTVVDMINEAKAAAIAASTVVAENSEFITIAQTGETGKTQTYTITTQDIASASATTNTINAEVTRAKAAEKANADAISAETQTRASEDTAIKGRLDVLEGVEVTGENAITVSESGATESKVVSLKLGTQPAEGVAGVVLSQDTNGLVAKLYWGTF